MQHRHFSELLQQVVAFRLKNFAEVLPKANFGGMLDIFLKMRYDMIHRSRNKNVATLRWNDDSKKFISKQVDS